MPAIGEAFERVPGRPDAPLVLSCEHASERLPDPWRWSARDLRLVGTHWAFDLGAAALTRELALATGAPAVLSRFTRLLADPNRPDQEPSLFLARAEGCDVELNRAMTGEDRALRLERYWGAYHAALDRTLGESGAAVLLSMHTFSPVYDGERRTLEVGVLFDAEETLARKVAASVAAAGFRVALNEPYSGKEGLIYSADRHATEHGRRALEVELRQDLAVRPAVRARLVQALEVLGAG